MKEFMDKDFLLSTETAKKLYHAYAASMPIIDYHCHINPREIAENHVFKNITEAWLGGDHYKWRMIRSNGVEEKYITGNAVSDREKFQKFAESLPMAIGNPLYHWTHLELQRYFDCTIPLDGDSAEEIWQLCNEKLQQPEMSVLGLIKKSNVKVICTTDDPADDLCWHKKIKADGLCSAEVLPAMRPDKIMAIEKAGFKEYISVLGQAAGVEIHSVQDIYTALHQRMDYFAEMGCKASDHGLDYAFFRPAEAGQIEAIFQKALAGEMLDSCEIESYKTALLLFLGREYYDRKWVMQIHYSVQRNVNTKAFREIGADAGFDCMAQNPCGQDLVRLLDAMAQADHLPKMILYSLNPNDNALLGTVIGSFQGSEIAGKIQHGSAWWFNDSKTGMTDQLTNLANLSVLGNFVGMLTDSRSFLSYTRHEYFRRILCRLLGAWVEDGEYPYHEKRLKKIVEDISYGNAQRYFDF